MIEMDISKVREKKNFLFLSLVSKITSVLLIIFSAISVSLFLYNLVKNHLNKVKMNIGTFKAIGLSDSKTTGIYFGIIVKFVLVGLLLGLGTAFLIGSVLNTFLISNFQSDVGMKYFILLGLNTYITVGVVLVLSLLVSWYTIRKILSKSPGDLIYNR
jgi:ABC-type antimicrobial peptide transport system permease subunit